MVGTVCCLISFLQGLLLLILFPGQFVHTAEAQHHDMLGKITASSRHLLGLINEVLDMSKIESGKITLNEEEFSLSDLLNELLVMIQPQVKEHKHELQVHILNLKHEDVVGDSTTRTDRPASSS